MSHFTAMRSPSSLAFMSNHDDPLVSDPPTEVALPNAPLVRVLAQIRFPLVIAIDQREFVSPFQEAIRAAYPILRQEQTQGVIVTDAGPVAVAPQTAWRFSDVEGAWRVSLTPSFLSLETTAYTSRRDFLMRLREVTEQLDVHVSPRVTDRVGIRYIDRITGDNLERITELVRPEFRGILGSSAATKLAHTMSETSFHLENARLVARWGYLPPRTAFDPATIEPIDEPCWILDLDMFGSEPMNFSVDGVMENAREFAERIYTVFRWAVTQEFLKLYGGRP